MEDDFDLDISFDQDVNQGVLDAMSREDLLAAISQLPVDLIAPATGILLEKRSYSDVSQDLGIRQPELVRFIHRSTVMIVEAT